MKANEIVKLVGNFNRVREMKKGNLSDKMIALGYKEENMKLTTNDVKVICKVDKMFTTQSFPKKKAKAMIKAKKIIAEIAEEIRSSEKENED